MHACAHLCIYAQKHMHACIQDAWTNHTALKVNTYNIHTYIHTYIHIEIPNYFDGIESPFMHVYLCAYVYTYIHTYIQGYAIDLAELDVPDHFAEVPACVRACAGVRVCKWCKHMYVYIYWNCVCFRYIYWKCVCLCVNAVYRYIYMYIYWKLPNIWWSMFVYVCLFLIVYAFILPWM